MDEINQGFNNDLSKTFDTDESFEKVRHTCTFESGKKSKGMFLLPVGSVCPLCCKIVTK